MTPADYALMGIDAETILLCWSWGFGTVILMWSMGFGLGAALQLIRQL